MELERLSSTEKLKLLRDWLTCSREDLNKHVKTLIKQSREVANENPFLKQLELARAIIHALHIFEYVLRDTPRSVLWTGYIFRIVDRETGEELALQSRRICKDYVPLFEIVFQRNSTEYVDMLSEVVKNNTKPFENKRTWCAVLLDLGYVWKKFSGFDLVAYSMNDWDAMTKVAVQRLGGWRREVLEKQLSGMVFSMVGTDGTRALTSDAFKALAESRTPTTTCYTCGADCWGKKKLACVGCKSWFCSATCKAKHDGRTLN